MSGIRWLKCKELIILSSIIVNSSTLAALDNLFQPQDPPVDLDHLIENIINTNINIRPLNDLPGINYYDYYYLINNLYKHSLSDLLDITEPASVEEEPEIEDDGKLIVNINLNYENIDAISTIFKEEDGDILFPLEDLFSFDVEKEYLEFGQTKFIDEKTYISLKSLPGSRYKLNSETQILTLNFPPGCMKKQYFDAKNQAHVGADGFSHRANGAYLNYDITLTNSKNLRSMNGLQDLTIFTEKGSGTNSIFIRKDLNGKDVRTHFRRLESYWTIENEQDLTRWNYGDSTTYSAPWSGSTRFAGVQYSSNLAIKPDIVTHPLINFAGTIESPSDISVYSNTQEIYNSQLKTGNFDINNLPITTGSGDLIVKLKDITGKLQTVIIPYYNTPELLTPGLSEFSYSIGMQRQHFTQKNNKYKNIVTSFDYMRGINDNWTTGGHFESLNDIFSVGITNINKIGLYGAIQTSLANTHRHNLNSQRAKIEYSFQGKKLSFFTGLTLDRGSFPDTFTFNKDYLSKGSGRSFQTSIGYGDSKFGSAFVSFTSTKVTDKNSSSQVNILSGSYSKDLTKDSIIRLNCGTNLRKNKKDKDVYMTLSYIINFGVTSVSTGLSKRSGHKGLAKNISINSPSHDLTDWGYAADASTDYKYSSYDISINKSTESVDTSFYFFDFNKNKSEQVSFMGSVIGIDKSIHFARPVQNSIALIKTTNFKNIPVHVDNHLIGTTNSQGQIVASQLNPYYPAEISLDANKVPLDAKFSYLTIYAIPHWKSGTILNFDITKVRSVQMKLLDNANVPLEVNRTLKIDGIADEVSVGYNGQVYVEDAKDLNEITGTSCNDENKCCSFNIPLNISEDELIDLGEEVCK